MQKDIGIIGGAGPEAGILLAKTIIKISQEKYGCKKDSDFPYLSLFSFPFADMLKNEDHEKVSGQLRKLIEKECYHTKYWAIACNTLHSYLGDTVLPNKFVNLLQETAAKVKEKPIVLCTSTSKKHKIHQIYFPCDYLDDSAQAKVDSLIDELIANEPSYKIYEQFLSLISGFKDQQIVLGCSEFSLLQPYFKNDGHIIDPLQLVAEKLCSLHFEEATPRML